MEKLLISFLKEFSEKTFQDPWQNWLPKIETRMIKESEIISILFPISQKPYSEIKTLVETEMRYIQGFEKKLHFFSFRTPFDGTEKKSEFSISDREIKKYDPFNPEVSSSIFPPDSGLKGHHTFLLYTKIRTDIKPILAGLISFNPRKVKKKEELIMFLLRTVSNRLDQLWESNQQWRLSHVNQELSLLTDPKRLYHGAADAIRRVLKAEKALIFVTDDPEKLESLTLVGQAGAYKGLLPDYQINTTSTTLRLLKIRKPIRLDDIRHDPDCNYSILEEVQGEFRHTTKAWCGVPILFQREVLGVINVINKKEGGGDRIPYFNYQEEMLLQKIAERLGQTMKELAYLKEQNQIIAQVAHNCRIPLQTIVGWNLISKRFLTELDSKQQNIPNLINELKQGQEQIQIASELAEIFLQTTLLQARSSFDSMEREQERTFSLSQELRDLARLWEAKGQEYEKTIRVSSTLPTITGPYNQLRQLFANLFDNAVKYSHSRQEVKVKGYEEKDKIVILIESYGQRAYRNQQEREALLNPFYRAKDKDPRRYIFGSGLGLPLCHKIIKNYGGKLNITSYPGIKANEKTGEGYNTVVTVTLPILSKRRK